MHAGANLISYPSIGSTLVGDAILDDFASYIDGVIGEGEAASLLPNGSWVGSLTQFSGGKGYWFNVNQDFIFNFNFSENQLTRPVDSKKQLQKYPEGMTYNQSIYQAFYFI